MCSLLKYPLLASGAHERVVANVEHDDRVSHANYLARDRFTDHARTVERSIVVVVRYLYFDRVPTEHAPMVVSWVELLAESDRGETFERIRFDRKSNLEG